MADEAEDGYGPGDRGRRSELDPESWRGGGWSER